jgi:glycosyltransferase involved in cell wall biosynthesis
MTLSASVVLLARNESTSIGLMIERTHKAMTLMNGLFEIIVMDNSSDDDTRQVVLDLINTYPMLKIITQQVNVGYAMNVKSGLEACGGEYIYVFDGDGQFDPLSILEMDQRLRNGVDLVLGYRTQIAGPLLRKLLSRIFLLSSRLIIGFKLRDINSGARGLSRRLVSCGPVSCGSSMVNAELCLVARTLGFSIDEVAVGHERRAGGFSSHQFLKPLSLFRTTIGYLFLLRKKYLK